MTPTEFRTSEVLGNLDPAIWRTGQQVRGALRLTVPQVVGRLTYLRGRGLAASRFNRQHACLEYRLTERGRGELARIRDTGPVTTSG